jgi:hypothetical protein
VNSAIRLAILGISQSTMSSSKCLTMGVRQSKEFWLSITGRSTNPNRPDVKLRFPVESFQSGSHHARYWTPRSNRERHVPDQTTYLSAYGGPIRRSSEPYLKVPSLGGLRCG